MKLLHEEYDNLSVIHLKGDLTADHVAELRRLVEERLGRQVRDFVLDLHEVEFVDSQGLQTLLWLQDQCTQKLGQVRLAGLGANVGTIFRLTRLASRFDQHADVEAAIRGMSLGTTGGRN